MALKVELKPGEKLLVGQCIITNSEQRSRLFIDGKAPILREKDILTTDTADTPAKRIYLAVQLMYIQEDIDTLREEYFSLINDFVTAAPSTISIADRINNAILTGELYKALKTAKELIQYEQDLFEHAAIRRGSLSVDGEDG
ncbi:putative flagellum biosynthesis repressor protein FlbT 1 [Devosia yakushimensis]|uniref:Flagellum biosynthesis repressor protein FlbT 1 n=1 Tax=Devosia yakushimensis TaxID=470028 RepID=A0ABQ5UBH4_9HYPH|nr:flagellar biosynthesis repressor FlbT [Devosia yakushimensis]GLQ08983.1 putative flagellum biosynthesis repressor protein FlbT 1 [Devosia yakushimensis]